jgi:DNA-binding MarR family transcriptional regulator
MELPAADIYQAQTLVLTTIIDAGNIVQRALEKRLGAFDLGVAQQRLLALVYYAGESLTVSMLAAVLLQETHSVSGLLNRLEERGLITRSYDREDRRVIWVGLTPEARAIAEESVQVVLEVAREFKPMFDARNGRAALKALAEVQNQGFRMVGTREALRQEALRRISA